MYLSNVERLKAYLIEEGILVKPNNKDFDYSLKREVLFI